MAANLVAMPLLQLVGEMEPNKSGLQEQISCYHTTCTAAGPIHSGTLSLPLKLHTTTAHMMCYRSLACHASCCVACVAWHHWQTTLDQKTGSFGGQVLSCACHKEFNTQSTTQVCVLWSTIHVWGVSVRALPCITWQLSEKHPLAAKFDLVNIGTVSTALTTRTAFLGKLKGINAYLACLCTQ